ncbi:MAG: VOC family protein [Solirubrobacteraceae bacterium]|nr:VOC family protein [Solirubrobacteraceae bacterium]
MSDLRLSLVTLGVTDVPRATAFYESVGFRKSSSSVEGDVTFFEGAGTHLGLWGATNLAEDAHLPDDPPQAFRGSSLSMNLPDRATVDAVFAEWVAAGATPRTEPEETPWGGYTSYVTDPDGHLWEFAHNPGWPLDERGLPELP